MPAHPDANVYPEATGLAKALVEKHQVEQPLKLYSGWFCPFVQRVWLCLEEKQIPYEYIEVNPYYKPDSLLALNPRGLVPTLSIPADPHPKPLFESTIVNEYLEQAYPSHGLKLLPEDPYERAQARIWIDYVTSRIIPAFHRFLQYQPAEGATALEAERGIDKLRQEFLGHLQAWTKEMHPEGPFFLGSQISLVDITLAPWAVRLWVFDELKSGLGNTFEGDQVSSMRWKKWLGAIESRDSIKQTTSKHEHYLPIYQRYADNTAQSELAKASRAGRGVP